jgi:O-antigen/teichoic acid export membrane protein
MGIVQKDAFRTMLISYGGIGLGYLNKGLLFLLILTTEQIGLVNLIISFGTLFAQFSNLGTIYSTWKFLPFFKNEAKKHHGFLPLILLIVFVGISFFTALSLIFRHQIEEMYREHSAMFVSYYYWFIPIGISYVLFMVLEMYLRSFYKNIISVVAYDIVLRLAVTLLFALIYFKLISFDLFVILHSLIYLIPTGILLLYLKRMGELNLFPSTIQISKRFRKIVISFSAFNYINTLGVVLVGSMDVIMIAQMIGLEGTGVYTTIIFLTSALQVPYKSIIRVSSPLVSDYWKSREIDKMKELYRKVSSVSLVIGLGLFCGIWNNIDFLFTFFKPEFQSGIWVFFFLMMGRLVDMYFGINGAILTTSKKFKYDIYFTCFLIFTVFFLNLWLIPIWGIVGAAISTSVAILVYNLGRLLFVWFVFKIHPFHKNQFVIILLGLLSLLVGWLTSDQIENKYAAFIMQSLFVLTLFFAPIYWFKLEPESVNYLNKGTAFVRSRLGGRKEKKM